MDRKLKSPSERIKHFAKNYYGGIGKLANVINMPQSTFSQYTSKKNPQKPGHDFLIKMYEAGCSTNWILYGHGNIFAQNDTGIKLRKLDLVDSTLKENQNEVKLVILNQDELTELIKKSVKSIIKEE